MKTTTNTSPAANRSPHGVASWLKTTVAFGALAVTLAGWAGFAANSQSAQQAAQVGAQDNGASAIAEAPRQTAQLRRVSAPQTSSSGASLFRSVTRPSAMAATRSSQ